MLPLSLLIFVEIFLDCLTSLGWASVSLHGSCGAYL